MSPAEIMARFVETRDTWQRAVDWREKAQAAEALALVAYREAAEAVRAILPPPPAGAVEPRQITPIFQDLPRPKAQREVK